MNINEKVLDILRSKGEPMKAGEIAEASGLEKGDVDKALKELKKNEEVNSPKRCYYYIAE
ncbi:MAG: MarR family transcriptional regulator [Clostridium sp.]|uniref:MarR family transcriptional regulator n=1 Tax=Clostridium sp. TaxID=1506 RepID=UPI002FC75830